MIVPAHNEERSIRVAVRNLLALDYPQLEIIVINDGSEDRTLDEMQEEFRLRRVRAVYISEAEWGQFEACTGARWTQGC